MPTKLKIKQINADAAALGGVIVKDSSGMKYTSEITSSIALPAGSTAQRPLQVPHGSIRFNNETGLTEQFKVTNDPNPGDGVWFPLGGGSAYLGDPSDGSYTESRYSGGKIPAVSLTNTTPVADAIDNMNEILGLLLPDPPPNLNGTFDVTGDANHLVTSGATSHSGVEFAMPTAGSSVARITGTLSTSTIQDVGPGNTGTVQLYVDGSNVVGESLTFSDEPTDAKSSGSLRISDNKWGGFATGTSNPAPAGFYQTYDVAIQGHTLAVGYHTVRVRHYDGGNTYQTNAVQIMVDDMTSNPVITNEAVTENTKNGVYSSGIEHYASGSSFNVVCDLQYIAGQCYKSGYVVRLTGQGSNVDINPGNKGVPSPVTVDFARVTPHSFSGIDSLLFTIGTNYNTVTGGVTITAQNINGSDTATVGGNWLIQSGSGIQDASISAFGSTASRVYLTHTSTPGFNQDNDTPASLTESAWNSSVSLASVGYTHEAVVVGGVLKSDRTDWSTNYLPAGNPNYSTKGNDQYVTYKFTRVALSNFTVTLTGSYSGAWVALPGVSDNSTSSPNALGGAWWNCYVAYNGSGIPGRTGDSAAGCGDASNLADGNGTFKVNLGAANTTDSGGVVYVRLKLTGSQSITALSIS